MQVADITRPTSLAPPSPITYPSCSPPADAINPVENTDSSAGTPQEDLGFPFVTSEEDVARLRSSSLTNLGP